MAYRYLLTHRDGPVARLTLTRPDVRNAFNEEMIAELTHWAAATADDDEVRAVVLDVSHQKKAVVEPYVAGANRTGGVSLPGHHRPRRCRGRKPAVGTRWARYSLS